MNRAEVERRPRSRPRNADFEQKETKGTKGQADEGTEGTTATKGTHVLPMS